MNYIDLKGLDLPAKLSIHIAVYQSSDKEQLTFMVYNLAHVWEYIWNIF